MAAKTANFGPEIMRGLEKQILLLVLDRQWKDHLLSLDHLRQGVQLRAYGQRDPLIEYKREAFDLFETMLAEVREETVSLLSRIRSEEHTSELQSLMRISYAVFCLKKKKPQRNMMHTASLQPC